MLCRSCGKDIPAGAVYCVYCGANTQGDAVDNKISSQQNIYKPLNSTTRGKRLANFFVDIFIIMFFSSFLGNFMFFSSFLGNFINTLSMQHFIRISIGIFIYVLIKWLIIPIAYYFLFELWWSKTPAKYLTKTHVVTDTGVKPAASQLAIRSLARWIPFEQFSFLSAAQPIGWHDHLSHTRVVDD